MTRVHVGLDSDDSQEVTVRRWTGMTTEVAQECFYAVSQLFLA